MNLKNKISIIIPAYNEEKYISECIESIRKQTLSIDTEIIVIDDGSTDKTVEFSKELKIIVLQQTHKGSGAARNLGLTKATGDFILFLDGDDRLEEDAFETFFVHFNVDNNLQIVFSKALDFISEELSEKEKNILPIRNEPYGGCLPGCSLIKKEVFGFIGGFDESLKTGETVDWQFKVKDLNLKIINVDKTTLRRRIHPQSTGLLHKEQEKKDYVAIIRKRMGNKNGTTC